MRIRLPSRLIAVLPLLLAALTAAPAAFIAPETVAPVIAEFNRRDEELYPQHIPNAAAWDFLRENIPFFSCPDADLERTYYFRWWTFRKHLKQTPDGFVITEFLPAVKWAGKHNAINCPAAHQIREGRWLRDPRYVKDYLSFYLTDPESKPRNYSFWAADSLRALTAVHPDPAWEKAMLPRLVAQFEGWTKERRDPGFTLFWQFDMRDGMEWTVGGKQLNRGQFKFMVPMLRPTINSYLFADAQAIAALATTHGEPALAAQYHDIAETLRAAVLRRLWNDELKFFTPLPRRASADAQPIAVREQMGYVPWCFNLPPTGQDYEVAWKQLMDPQGFYAPFGPTTCEQRHPDFTINYADGKQPHCQWNGPSWPFATSQTLTALANVLHDYPQDAVTKADYFATLKIYTRSHAFRQILPDDLPAAPGVPRLENRVDETLPWIDENLDPFTGNWLARTRLLHYGEAEYKERGKDYNHSTYCDLIISGLVGLRVRDGGVIEVAPLVPDTWDWFCLDRVKVQGRELAVVWDRTGKKFNRGAGLTLYLDGKIAAHADTLTKLTARGQE